MPQYLYLFKVTSLSEPDFFFPFHILLLILLCRLGARVVAPSKSS